MGTESSFFTLNSPRNSEAMCNNLNTRWGVVRPRSEIKAERLAEDVTLDPLGAEMKNLSLSHFHKLP
jgi:hypothetical protein